MADVIKPKIIIDGQEYIVALPVFHYLKALIIQNQQMRSELVELYHIIYDSDEEPTFH